MSDVSGAFDALYNFVDQWTEEKKDQTEKIMKDVAAEGVTHMHERILSAVTPWGSARASGLVGGPPREHAGRYESGKMYEAVEGDAEWVDSDKTEIVAHWGWTDPDEYYKWQEEGTDHIAAMEALPISLFDTEEYFKLRMGEI